MKYKSVLHDSHCNAYALHFLQSRVCTFLGGGGSTSASSTSTSSYPPDLGLLVDLMDLKGRELIRCLRKSSSESAPTNSKNTSTYRPWAGYNRAANNAYDERKGEGKRRRKINSDGDSEDEDGDGDEGCSVSYDSDGSGSAESIASDEDDDVSVSDAPSDGHDDEGEDGGDKVERSKSQRERRTKGLPIMRMPETMSPGT